MFYIFVEIFSWKQLYKLENETMTELDLHIGNIINQQGGSKTALHPMLFSFSSYYEESMERIIDTLYLLKDLLSQYENLLHGYSIILTVDRKGERIQINQIQNLCYKTVGDKSIWMDRECLDECESFVGNQPFPGILKIVSRKDRGPLLPERKQIICQRKELNLFLNVKVKTALKDKHKKVIKVNYQNAEELFSSLGYWIELKGYDNNILYLSGNSNHQIYSPFFESLNQTILEWGIKRAKNPALWNLLNDIYQKDFGKIRRDCFSKDFIDSYQVYLEGFLEFCRENEKPPIFIVSSVDQFHPKGIKLLQDLLNDDSETTGQLFLIQGCSEDCNFDFSVQEESFQLFFPDKFDVQQKMIQAFPGKEWTQLMDWEKHSSKLSPQQWFIAGQLTEKGSPWESHEQALRLILEELAEPLRMILFFIYSYPEWAYDRVLDEVLTFNDMDSSRTRDFLERLEYMCLIRKDFRGCYRLLWNISGEILQGRIDQDLFGKVNKKFSRYLWINWNDGQRVDPYLFLHQMEQNGNSRDLLNSVNFLLNWLLDNHLFEAVEELLQQGIRSPMDSEALFEESLQNLMNGARVRLALLQSDPGDLVEQVSSGRLSLVTAKGDYSDFFSLQIARYFLATGSPEQALNFSKEALFGFQKTGNHLGEVYANLELALSLLNQKKLGPALDYFEIARRIAWQLNQNYGLILSSTLECVAIYIFGNLSLAYRNIDSLLESTKKEGRRDRSHFLSFLKGRIHFDLGNYDEAAGIFCTIKNESKAYGYHQCSLIAHHWEARCHVYQHKGHQAYGMLSVDNPSREELFFLAEADFMEDRLESAIMKLDKAMSIKHPVQYNRSERVAWTDGYQVVEGWLLSEENEMDILEELIEGLRWFLLGLKGQRGEAVQGLQKLIKRVDFPFHPYTQTYLYQLSQISTAIPLGERGDDQLVHLSRAIEKLQSRAGRMDDQKKKMGYLNRNYWNSKIMEEAHKKKFLQG